MVTINSEQIRFPEEYVPTEKISTSVTKCKI